MIDSIVTAVQNFRTRLFRLFRFRADATMDLIDAMAANNHRSVVEISLSPLFRRQYPSITDVTDNMFRIRAEQNPTDNELTQEQIAVSGLLTSQCPPPGIRGFTLMAVDCTAKPRIYSSKLKDRTATHAPNHIPGQKPITIGHEYSLVVYLPEDEGDKRAHWTYPLSMKRVCSNETGPQVGFEQVQELLTKTSLQCELCVVVTDAAYSTKEWVVRGSSIPNLVQIARLRNNRILYRQAASMRGVTRRGRPATYGESFFLKQPPPPEEVIWLEKFSSSGKHWRVRIARWTSLLMKGDKGMRADQHSFDVVQVQVFGEDGKLIFKKPLWLMVGGKRRGEISLRAIYESYSQRYDIEHCFRFGKQNLLLASPQTPDTRHEENLTWLTMLSFAMLYSIRKLAKESRRPWEKHKKIFADRPPTISQVQRDYQRIIQGIGTPACIPKPRGKSIGRQPGAIVPHREFAPVIRKHRLMAVLC